MANDSILIARRALLRELEARMTLVAAGSIHPLGKPAWPFIRAGSPSSLPIRATGIDGARLPYTFHAFAKPRYEAEAVVETAEDHCARIASEMASALDRRLIIMENGRRLRVFWTGTRLQQDGAEADAWHAIVSFEARAIGC